MRGPAASSSAVYLLFLLLPIYWLVNMSLKTNTEIIYRHDALAARASPSTITSRSSPIRAGTPATSTRSTMWRINTVLSIALALPAAYAFSRYRFLGDKHLFFWLLSNRMAPPAVFALPFFNLYSAIGLFDTPWAVALAHCLFNVPLAVWILEGFMSGVPREIDETAYHRRLFLPALLREDLHAADRLAASASPPSSASCSPGSSCCWRAR